MTQARPKTRCARCNGSGRIYPSSAYRWEWCPRCNGAKAMTYPRSGDLVVFWRNGRVKLEKAVHWDVVAAPSGDEWTDTVLVRSRASGRKRLAFAYLLWVVREVEMRVCDAVMGGVDGN